VFTGNLTQGDRNRAVVGAIQGLSLHMAGGGQMVVDATGQIRVGAGVAGLAPDLRLSRTSERRCPQP